MQLLIWSPSAQAPVQRHDEHKAAIKAIAWSPHQHGVLASGGGTADRTIRFWNTVTGQALQSIDTGSQVRERERERERARRAVSFPSIGPYYSRYQFSEDYNPLQGSAQDVMVVALSQMAIKILNNLVSLFTM